MKRFVVCWLFLLVPGWLEAGEPTAKPILVLDSGGHTDSIPKVLFTLDGKGLISVSKDKTIRIWDLDTGTCVRTMRPPIGPGRFGTLYAAALSPDGRLAFAGMGPQAGESPIFLINLVTGQIERTFKGHTTQVRSLAFTPDGKFLISGSTENPTRIWNAATGECVHVLQEPRSYAWQIAVSPDSRKVLTGSMDGTARIWSLATGKCEVTMKDTYRERYYSIMSVAWSKDGKTIATGSADWRVRLWNPDGTLRKIFGSLGDTAWGLDFSPNSKELLLTRGMNERTDCSILDVASGEERVNFAQHQAFAWDCAYSPHGKRVASADFLGEILVWNPEDGSIVHRLAGHSQAVWSTGWSADGTTIAWGNRGKRGQRSQFHPLERTFHLPELELGGVPGKGFQQARESTDSWTLERTQFNRVLSIKTRDGTPVRDLSIPNEPADCFTWIGKDRVAIGSYHGTFLLDGSTGEQLRSFQGNTGEVLALAPSPDERYLLSGSADHTLRIWNLDQTEPLLSLFFARDDWIAWTPQGYYAASPGGERLMGWQVNNGVDKMATFHPAAQFRKSFYRPDVIKLLLKTGSVEKALALADEQRGKATSLLNVTEVLPPLVVLTTPDRTKVETADAHIEVRALARAQGKHPITSLRLLVNGRPQGGKDGIKSYAPARAGEVRESWQLELIPGVNTVQVQAESAVSKALSEPVEIHRTQGSAGKDQNLPNLYILAIGVSAYPREAMKLKYAAKDAQVLARTFQATSHALYQSVEVKVLTDQDATRRNILQGLAWMRKQMTQRDVAIVSFAGHGDKDSGGNFYLLPVDVDEGDLVSTAVPADQVKNLLGGIPGRMILLLDACHAGAAGSTKRRSGGALTDDLVRDLATEDYGVIVMSSSTGREFSLESTTAEHGYFTLAVVEGLTGKADYNKDQVVHWHELDQYVTGRVKELSQGKQHPVTTRPASIRSFALTQVKTR